jgi:hypothetical protein
MTILFLPAHCGHHLNPIEGFWRVMKDAIGAGRCLRDLPTLYQRTRQVLMAHQERPIYYYNLSYGGMERYPMTTGNVSPRRL